MYLEIRKENKKKDRLLCYRKAMEKKKQGRKGDGKSCR